MNIHSRKPFFPVWKESSQICQARKKQILIGQAVKLCAAKIFAN